MVEYGPLIARPKAAHRLTPSDRAHGLSRRRMLGGAVATAGLATLSQGVRTVGSAPTRQASPVSGVVGETLVEPPVLRSADGRLDVALEAQFGPAMIGGRAVTTYTYNGQAPGPTLRLQPGDSLDVT